MRSWIFKHKLVTVLLAALFTVLLLMVLVRIPEQTKYPAVAEENGVYDLTKIAELNTSAVHLTSPDAYYPGTYLMPESVETAVPVSTEQFDALRTETLSQRFILLLPDDGIYTMTFRLFGCHALRVYVNGERIGESGRLGATKRDTEVWTNNLTVSAVPKDGKMDIILQSAEFHHVKWGATLAELMIGRQGAVTDPFSPYRTEGLLVMGGLLSAAASLLGIYLMLSRTKATLYFALACVAMALREAIHSQAWTYFPLSGNVAFMLEYLSLALLTVFLTLYLGQYADNRPLKILRFAALTGSGLYGACVLLGDSVFYTSVLTAYEVLLLLCIIPSVAGLFYKMRNPNKEQAAALYGIGVFFLSAVADIFMYLGIFDVMGNDLPISDATMLIFALVQAFSLYQMNNRVLSEAREEKQKLAAENAALESLDRMKTEFLGNVTHELKTPLAVVSGYAQDSRRRLLEKDDASALLPAQMQLICAETERMSLMIGHVLDATRIDEGRMTMTLQKVSVVEIIQKTAESYFPMLQQNGNRLQLSLPEALPFVSADAERAGQVLLNLLSNAMRHTQKGLITIAATEKEGFVEISVSDTGEGIDSELLPRLFTRYATGRKKARADTGTGLGLFICKHMTEAHGGTISAENRSGGGACFRFTLPIHT